MVRSVGFEPTTCGLEVRCSIQLSYWGALPPQYTRSTSSVNMRLYSSSGYYSRDSENLYDRIR